MNLVCPHEPSLLMRLDGRTILVRVDDPRDIVPAAGDTRSRNKLARVLARSEAPLAETAIAENWRGIAVDLAVPSCGPMLAVLKLAPLLRRLEVRVVLPAEPAEFAGAKVLASLGVPVAVALTGVRDWEAVADLMTYALIGQVVHAPIEPFATLAAGFRLDGLCRDWGRAEYDDPTRFLHLDRDGRIAFSARECAAGEFFGELTMLDSIALHAAARTRGEAWRELFAQNHFCARCRAFRLCRARVAGGKRKPDGCDGFFDDMMDVLARRAAQPDRRAGRQAP